LVQKAAGENRQQFYLALASLDEEFLQRGHDTKDALEGAGYGLEFHEYEAEPAPEADANEYAENEEYEESEETGIREPHVSIGDFVTWLKATLPPY
jgi:hypothetical protein